MNNCCAVCEQNQPINPNHGILICQSCSFFFKRSVMNVIIYKCICKLKTNPLQPCKACRLKKCHQLKISAANFRPNPFPPPPPLTTTSLTNPATTTITTSPTTNNNTENKIEDCVKFAELLENLLEVCNANMLLTTDYIINGDRSVIDIATKSYAQRKLPYSSPKYKQMWKAMMTKHKINWNEIPVLLDITLRYYYPEVAKIVDPIHSAENRKEQLKDLKYSVDRFDQLHVLSHYLLSVIIPTA